MSYYGFHPYVPVAKRRAIAAREVEKLKKKGRTVSPVVIKGRAIVHSFWGKAWSENLERYSDYENRLPRGRTYVRNGSVVDLQIERGQVRAMVSGSELYSVKIEIDTVSKARWQSICKDCLGSVGSLVELLLGKLSKNVMERVCREGDGLFPSPREIKMRCSCPDWAGMCKHTSAAMYGAGARLDAEPDLLFTLRGVDRSELIAGAGTDLPMTQTQVAAERALAQDDVAALFGIEMGLAPSEFGINGKNRSTESVTSGPAQRATSNSRQSRSDDRSLQKDSIQERPTHKRSTRAPSSRPSSAKRPEKTGATMKSVEARIPREKVSPSTKSARAFTKALKKEIPAIEPTAPKSESRSRRRILTTAAKWIKSKKRKRR
ncbi:MAG: hypothetical protein ABSE69_02660 [Roseiarcus sp.]